MMSHFFSNFGHIGYCICFSMDCAHVLLHYICRHQKKWMFYVLCQLLFAVKIMLLLNFTSVKVEILMAFMAWHYWVRVCIYLCLFLWYVPYRTVCLCWRENRWAGEFWGMNVEAWSQRNCFNIYCYNSQLIIFTDKSRNANCISACYYYPTVLWRCWLGGRKGIWPVSDI